MKCKKITGNVLDILDNDDECSRFLKKWIHDHKYRAYTANTHMRAEELLRTRDFNCSDRDKLPPEIERKIKEVLGKKE